MSTAAARTPARELQNYARTWAKSVAVAQGTIPGATCEVFAHAPASAAAFRNDDLWITANFLGELAGTVALRIGRAGARRLMPEPASGNLEAAEELSADSKAALLDWIHRAAVDVLASMQLGGGRPDPGRICCCTSRWYDGYLLVRDANRRPASDCS